ncbi:transcription termination/antitermination protein NusA [Mycoplasmopsis caviae]|uniref:N utilization substance protein A n=1 Tax=Mycoplasmopsis caviae TaxID=55603 RepID=A0A3P8KBD4_9BACT|nr:NusA N-terminal domain-containing protein [Mycoplasmopsis caviae]UUD35327.1 transcription termination/antitermination protein NusA [Mycoplasmopsis caviae]VDR41894.1 N utilization substance protein A [Mycoplasmopsis caviae]
MPKKSKTSAQVTLNVKKAWYQILNGYFEKEKLPMNEVVQIFSVETTRIINKLIDPDAEIVFEIDEAKQEVSIYNNNVCVTKEPTDLESPESLISFVDYDEVHSINSKIKEGDIIKWEIDLSNLTKSQNSEAKKALKIINSSIAQAIKILQKKKVFEQYSGKIGETVKVVLNSKNSNGSWNVQIVDSNVNAFLPAGLISSKRKANPGQYFDVVIEKVSEESKLSQIEVSLDSPKIVYTVLKNNIPEIAEGLIEIVGVYRQPGERTKVSVKLAEGANPDIDARGAIIGENGSRIEILSEKLDGERIDVVLYDEDIRKYIANAMSPIPVVDVVPKPKEENKYYVIVVPEHLTPAIGKKGVNTLLASNLTKAKLDIISTTDAKAQGIVFDESLISSITSAIKREGTKVKYQKPANNRKSIRKQGQNIFSNSFNSIDVSNFDQDIAAFELHEQDKMDSLYEDDDNFEELVRKIESEFASEKSQENVSEEQVVKTPKKDNKISTSDYKKAKEVAKNFVVDDDLSKFGLDDFDLGDIDFDEYEDK